MKYLDEIAPDAVVGHRTAPRSGQTVTGYGTAIPSGRVVELNGRTYRVYVTIFSNAGTAWIKVKGEKIIVR